MFYYLCYEGAIDLNAIQDWNQRHALEVQIMEFGQIPKQIFEKPHPPKTCLLLNDFKNFGKITNIVTFFFNISIYLQVYT